MTGAHVPDVHVSKKIKCENPFPNWKPITKISYIELDIIVSRLVSILKSSFLFIIKKILKVYIRFDHLDLISPNILRIRATTMPQIKRKTAGGTKLAAI